MPRSAAPGWPPGAAVTEAVPVIVDGPSAIATARRPDRRREPRRLLAGGLGPAAAPPGRPRAFLVFSPPPTPPGAARPAFSSRAVADDESGRHPTNTKRG